MYEMFIEVAAGILFMLLVSLIGALGAWVLTKIGKRNELANIAEATGEAIDAAQRVVLELQQTTVEAMKAASEDGKLTGAEIEHLGALLLEKALAQMSEPAKKILAAAGKDVCAIIKSAGEAVILALKKG